MVAKFVWVSVLTLATASLQGSLAAGQELQQPNSIDTAWLEQPEANVVPTSAMTLQSLSVAPQSPCDAPDVSSCMAGCETGCEKASCCNMCPCVYGEVEGLFLKRSSTNSGRTILMDADTQATLVSSSDLDFGFDPGIRALFGFRLWGCRSVEFGYFGLFDSWASTEYAAPNRNIDVTLPGPLGIASNVFHDGVRTRTEYASRIQGAEVNFPCCCCWECCCDETAGSREWFAGFRYLSLREYFRISGAKPVGSGVETGYYETTSRNDLYGAQVGGRLRRCLGVFSWEATGKAGVFGNQSGQEQVFVDYPDFLLRPRVASNGGCVAFVGELNLTGIYQINRTWGLRAGYNVMWIEGVALAPDQLDFSFTTASGTGLDRSGGLFLHGVNVGLEARW